MVRLKRMMPLCLEALGEQRMPRQVVCLMKTSHDHHQMRRVNNDGAAVVMLSTFVTTLGVRIVASVWYAATAASHAA
jgi:hypothetical protein